MRMWHLLRSTNGYYYTINSLTKRLDTYGGNPPENMEATLLRMLSLLRRTHIYYINHTISFTCQYIYIFKCINLNTNPYRMFVNM